MDFLRTCLVLTVSLTLMAHVVFSAPRFGGDEVGAADFNPVFETDIMSFTPDNDDDDNSDDSDSDSYSSSSSSSSFYSRVPRQLGQMASGRRRLGGGSSSSSRRSRMYQGRLRGRGMYKNARDSYSERVINS